MNMNVIRYALVEEIPRKKEKKHRKWVFGGRFWVIEKHFNGIDNNE